MREPQEGVARAAGWMLVLPPLALTIFLASLITRVASGEVFSIRRAWVPALGVNLSFTLDGLSLLFALLITGIGTLVLIYAGGYLAGHPYLGRFYFFLLMFMASMLGLVLADNLLLIYVFWELTSLSSYFLIGFDHERAASRTAALQALLVTGAGGLALLAGLILLGQMGGSLEVSTLIGQAEELRAHPLYLPALILILLGAFTKSAQFPFHFWLPGAMEAPTPVSAYLHSATMVKAGVYLLARLNPAIGETLAWQYLVTIIGAVTMVQAGLLALIQTDLKRILAFSTVSALGLMVMLLGVGMDLAIKACLVFLLAHALYKGALFMIAGIVDHETGTRYVDRLGGLGRAMPVTAGAAALAAVSLAGFGPVLSFIGKEMALEAVLHSAVSYLLVPVTVLGGAFFVTVAGLAAVRPFYGSVRPTPRPAHEASLSLLLGPVILALAGFAAGIFPHGWVKNMITPAVTSVLGEAAEVDLALWHGFNLALGLSVASLVVGASLYFGWDWLQRQRARFEPLLRIGPQRGYELAMEGLASLAVGQTRLLQSGYLRYYLMLTMAATVGLASYALVGREALTLNFDWTDVRFYEAALVVLLLFAVAATIVAKTRLAAIASLGVVGYSVAIMFVLFGAPDLAMTQFLVETLTVILFVLVFYHLPESRIVSYRTARLRDAVLAGATGAVVTGFVLIGIPENYSPVSTYYEQNSVSGGHGRNVVNVIIVDFRALDTLGEITVLTAAALGVYALLKLRIRSTKPGETMARDSIQLPSDNLSQEDVASEKPLRSEAAGEPTASFILRTAIHLLLPLLLLFSFFLLIRGHNDPGGGFSAGLVTASAFILYRFAFGTQAVKRVLPASPVVLSGTGLLIALSSGVLALLEGWPMMTGFWGEIPVPGFGELHLGTPLLFDIGVFVTVVGVTLAIILPIAEK